MQNNEVAALFNKAAATYEKQWERMTPIRDTIYLLMEAIFVELPERCNLLSLGTGIESALLPLWNSEKAHYLAAPTAETL